MENISPSELAHQAAKHALSKKGYNIKILNLKDISSVCDYFVIISGAADMQVRAIANAIEDELRESGIKPYHIEGQTEGSWILIDYIDVVVHVFYEPTREFYSLEKLWGDAPIEEVVED
ncbi:MAG: ribosome silencing factor [bacterium]